ncbi:hypothetical protein [Halopseudomonas bauzanensis]|uniref:hypothetical protein n=1 Tax=Halopseudomonas bauzanensis TaxID=653930 RepID=UPI00255672A9|nr:hypothetical protein [Halopseudomonas bauzanensis]
MIRRAMLACLVLMLGACSDSAKDMLLSQLAENQKRLDEMEIQLLDARDGVDQRLVVADNSLRKLAVEYRGQHNDIVEQVTALQVLVADLGALQDMQDAVLRGLKEDVERLTIQFNKIQAAQSRPVRRSVQPATSVPTTKPVAPSFDVTGIELRGGRHFVAVASQGAQTLNQVRLLEVGESFAGWRVSRVGDRSAEFISGSGVVELAVQ